MRQLEIYSHTNDRGKGKQPQDMTATLTDDAVLEPGRAAEDVIKGQRKRLAKALGREPTDTEVFDQLVGWSNGYIAGREL